MDVREGGRNVRGLLDRKITKEIKTFRVSSYRVHQAFHFCAKFRPSNRQSTSQYEHQSLRVGNLVHLADEGVDVLLTVTIVTTLNEVLELALVEATSGVGELEGPEEVVGLLEVGANGVDLVDQILNTDDAVLAEVLLDDLVVGDGNALLVDLSVTALVDELTDALEVGVTVGDVGVDDGQHLLGSLGKANEGAVVDLEQTEELQDLAGLGRDLVDTVGIVRRLKL